MNELQHTARLNIVKGNNEDVVSIRIAALPLVVVKKDTHWFVHSPDLRVFGKSKISKVDAIDDFDKILENFLDIHVKRGTLEKALHNFNWKGEDDIYQGAKRFNIPLEELAGPRASRIDHDFQLAI